MSGLIALLVSRRARTEKARVALGTAAGVRRRVDQRRDEAEKRLAALRIADGQGDAVGVATVTSGASWRVAVSQRSSLAADFARAAQASEVARDEAEQAAGELAAASARERAVERVLERRAEEARRLAERVEQRELDDLVTNRYHRRPTTPEEDV